MVHNGLALHIWASSLEVRKISLCCLAVAGMSMPTQHGFVQFLVLQGQCGNASNAMGCNVHVLICLDSSQGDAAIKEHHATTSGTTR